MGLNYDTLRQATLATRLGSVGINTLTPDSFKFPKTHSFSVSYARRIFFNQVVEVGVRRHAGRDLVSRVDAQRRAAGRAAAGDRRQRGPVRTRSTASQLPTSARQQVPSVPGVPGHHVLRLRGHQRLQLAAGHAEPADRQATAVLRRLHPAARPRARSATNTATAIRSTRIAPTGSARGPTAHLQRLVERLPAGRRQGRDGQPDRAAASSTAGSCRASPPSPAARRSAPELRRAGRRREHRRRPTTARRTSSCCRAAATISSGIAPVYTCDPRLGGSNLGEKMLDINCIGLPGVRPGRAGHPALQPAHAEPDQQRPDALQELRAQGDQKLQFRVGFFNVFNMSYVTFAQSHERHRPDARHGVQRDASTTCPTATAASTTTSATRRGGSTTPTDTIANFGKINLLPWPSRDRVRAEVLLLARARASGKADEGGRPVGFPPFLFYAACRSADVRTAEVPVRMPKACAANRSAIVHLQSCNRVTVAKIEPVPVVSR